MDTGILNSVSVWCGKLMSVTPKTQKNTRDLSMEYSVHLDTYETVSLYKYLQ